MLYPVLPPDLGPAPHPRRASRIPWLRIILTTMASALLAYHFVLMLGRAFG